MFARILRLLFRTTVYSAPVLLLGGWFFVENALPYWPIKPLRVRPQEADWRMPKGVHPEDYGLKAEPFEVRGYQDVRLKGYYIHAADSSKNTLIILHGISGCKEHFLPTAGFYASKGLNVVLFDMRAHGESGGDYNTFGYYEKRDVSAVVDHLLSADSSLRIGIMGNSLGGAVALQALAFDKRLRYGIIESTFHDLEAVTAEYGYNYFGVRSFALARHTLEKSAEIAHYEPFTIKPCEAAMQITQPVFMAHGTADERIPFSFGRQNFERLGSAVKQWYSVEGGRHHGLWKTGGKAYEEALLGFLEERIGN